MRNVPIVDGFWWQCVDNGPPVLFEIVGGLGRQVGDFTAIFEEIHKRDGVRWVRVNEPSTGQSKVITVRLPKDLHERLKEEAEEAGSSLNQFCVAKLSK